MSRSPMQRDFAQVRMFARELLEQVEHYERIVAKGENDDLRAVLINNLVAHLQSISTRMARRWRKARAEREQAGGERGTE